MMKASQVMCSGVKGIHESQKQFDQHIHLALKLMWEARNYAFSVNSEAWDFAVEVGELLRIGLSHSDIRWLMAMGYIESAVEITSVMDPRRKFLVTGKFIITDRSCFIFTDAGASAFSVGQFPSLISNGDVNHLKCLPNTDQASVSKLPEVVKPRWDADYRIVTYCGSVVKKFKLPSPNQEAILMAFEEENWPTIIHDPLAPRPDIDPKQRLHDTIRSLNRNQCHRLLCFRGNGTGEGILWEPVGFASEVIEKPQ